jgi:four helix bundle protein
MAKYQCFEELPVWQEATRLYNRVLDFLEEPNLPVSSGFRHQLDRAAFSVGSHIAEGFEWFGAEDRRSCIACARAAAAEIRSMTALIKERPKIQRYAASLQEIRTLADACARQLAGWAAAVDKRPVPEQSPSGGQDHEPRQPEVKGKEYRPNPIKHAKPGSSAYGSSDR